MRVAVVAGPDPGHAFPALALCLKFLAAGDRPTLLTGVEWLETARAAGVDAVELAGLDPTDDDNDADAGQKIHRRAARMAVLNVPRLRELHPDLVVSDVITACGGLAAGDRPTLLTGVEWLETARAAGVDAVELAGLDPTDDDNDADAGQKIHRRAARMAVLNVPRLRELHPDLVVSDVITACGGLAA